jgi:hypothetical protein
VSFTLHVDAEQWRGHADRVNELVDGLVPVAKGNGYGFGLGLLAAESQRLGCDTLAVGQPDEVAAVHEAFLGDVLVLTPWHPLVDPDPPVDDRLIVTAASPEAVRALAGSPTRVVVELLTSMRRFGLDEDALAALAGPVGRTRLEGFALHLPLDEGELERVDEVSAWVRVLDRLQLRSDVLWVSHLGDDELATLRRRHPGTRLRPRIGTRLWLGRRSSYRARGTVLAVHSLRRGQSYGYRQRRVGSDTQLLVVGGGTSHGVALAAPRPVRSPVSRAKAAAIGGMEAAGRVLSPFSVGGKRRWFAEPPHMQVSMVLLPADVTPPAVGDEVDVEIRMTTAAFDRLVLS